MRTIVEPIEHIDKLWGKQPVDKTEVYRLMQYVLRVDHEGKVLLHNIVTGRLVILEQNEAEVLDSLPNRYCSSMDQLIGGHYLVAEGFDEHLQVKKMRNILRMYNEAKSTDDITSYTILTTTACNARCYYCFEKGVKTSTMSEQTAKDVVKFITTHCGSRKRVSITWFGGEPTLTPDRIDQICTGLHEQGIEIVSKITTNGYLLDESMIPRAQKVWNLKSVNISMDGTEERYNRIKSYVNPKHDPYQKVMENIGLLINHGIRVNLRMNFDKGNYNDFNDLVQDAVKRFGSTPLINVSAHQINGEFHDDNNPHGTEEWFSKKIVELNDIARDSGLYRKEVRLPSLVSLGCKAAMKSTVTITPEGKLVRCPEQFGDDQTTGSVSEGITRKDIILSWKQLIEYQRCYRCKFYPQCLKIKNCSVGDRCCYYDEYSHIYEYAIKQRYLASQNESI